MRRSFGPFKLLTAAALLPFAFAAAVFAEERIESAFLKENEIASAIQSKLSDTIEKQNYALQVDVLTKRVSEDTATPPPSGLTNFDTSEELPGFERSKELIRPSVDDLLGETYLAVEKIKVALILHKKITPSETDFIRQMVPIVANFDFERGDEFKFIPITPDPGEEETVAEEDKAVPGVDPIEAVGDEEILEETTPAEAMEEETTPWDFIARNWVAILLGILALILLIALVRTRVSSRKKMESRPPGLLPEEEIMKLKEQQQQDANRVMENALTQDKNAKMNREVIAELLGDEKLLGELMEDLFKDKKGKNKLATLSAVFGEAVSRKLFSGYLPKESFLDLQQQAAKLNLKPEEETKILEELQSVLYAKKLSSGEKTEAKPFKFLDSLTSNQIAFLIKSERPNIQAIVLSRLDPGDAASIVKKFNPSQRAAIVESFGKMEKIPLELVKNVAYSLAHKARELPDDKTVSVDGVKALADMIGLTDANTRDAIINDLRTSNRQLSLDVENRMFVFESVVAVPREIVSRVFRKMPLEDVVIAIANSEKGLKETVIMAFPENVRGTMVAKLKSLSPWPSEKEILEKQKWVVTEMQALADSGKIDLKAIQSAWAEFKQKPQNNRAAS